MDANFTNLEPSVRDITDLNDSAFRNRSGVLAYLMILSVLGLLGNPLVLVVYLRQFRSSATRDFVVALSACYLVTSIVGLPILIYTMHYAYTISGNWQCQGVALFANIPMKIAGFLLLATAFERVIRKRKGRTRARTTQSRLRRAMIASCVVLISAFVAFLPTEGVYRKTEGGVTARMCWVTEKYRGTPYALADYVFKLSYFLVLMSLLVLVYSYILYTLWKRNRVAQESKVSNSSRDNRRYAGGRGRRHSRSSATSHRHRHSGGSSTHHRHSTGSFPTRKRSTGGMPVHGSVSAGKALAKSGSDLCRPTPPTSQPQLAENQVRRGTGTETKKSFSSDSIRSSPMGQGLDPAREMWAQEQQRQRQRIARAREGRTTSSPENTGTPAAQEEIPFWQKVHSGSRTERSQRGTRWEAPIEEEEEEAAKIPKGRKKKRVQVRLSKSTRVMATLTVIYVITVISHVVAKFLCDEPADWCSNFVNCGSNSCNIFYRIYYVNCAVGVLIFSICNPQFRRECTTLTQPTPSMDVIVSP